MQFCLQCLQNQISLLCVCVTRKCSFVFSACRTRSVYSVSASQENAVLSSVPAEPDQFTLCLRHKKMQFCLQCLQNQISLLCVCVTRKCSFVFSACRTRSVYCVRVTQWNADLCQEGGSFADDRDKISKVLTSVIRIRVALFICVSSCILWNLTFMVSCKRDICCFTYMSIISEVKSQWKLSFMQYLLCL